MSLPGPTWNAFHTLSPSCWYEKSCMALNCWNFLISKSFLVSLTWHTAAVHPWTGLSLSAVCISLAVRTSWPSLQYRSKWSGQALRGPGNGNRETEFTRHTYINNSIQECTDKESKNSNSQPVCSELLDWRAKETSRAFREAKWSANKESETSNEDEWSRIAIKESD